MCDRYTHRRSGVFPKVQTGASRKSSSGRHLSRACQRSRCVPAPKRQRHVARQVHNAHITRPPAPRPLSGRREPAASWGWAFPAMDAAAVVDLRAGKAEGDPNEDGKETPFAAVTAFIRSPVRCFPSVSARAVGAQSRNRLAPRSCRLRHCTARWRACLECRRRESGAGRSAGDGHRRRCHRCLAATAGSGRWRRRARPGTFPPPPPREVDLVRIERCRLLAASHSASMAIPQE